MHGDVVERHPAMIARRSTAGHERYASLVAARLVCMKPSAEVARGDPVAPLLKTKLEAPRCPRLVVRENLIETLSEGVSLPLTLVYGPAGSGKTMLVAQWRASAREERPVAWLSLDADDNDPARFWIYVIEALRSV